MVVLITGGSGFIGSHIAELLANKGFTVRVLDNFSTSTKKNLDGISTELVKGDIQDFKTVKDCMEDVEFVLHQAALASVPRSISNPIITNTVNICGTLNVLKAAQESNVKRVVFASSSSVYGGCEEIIKTETLTPLPLSPYALTKLAGEYYCKIFHSIYGLETVSLRYFNVYGPRQNLKSQYASVIPSFANRILNNKQPIIYGDGNQTRDFTFVKDVAQANIKAMTTHGISGEVFNIGSGKDYSINYLAEQVNEFFGTMFKPIYEDERPGDPKHTIADISKARKLLKFNPETSFEKGLRITLEWFQKNV